MKKYIQFTQNNKTFEIKVTNKDILRICSELITFTTLNYNTIRFEDIDGYDIDDPDTNINMVEIKWCITEKSKCQTEITT